MQELSDALRKLLFNKAEHEPLTADEQTAWDEYRRFEEMQINPIHLSDPRLLEAYQNRKNIETNIESAWSDLRSLIGYGTEPAKRIRMTVRWKWVAAAAIITVVATTVFLIVQRSPAPQNNISVVQANSSVVPGGRKATLTVHDEEVLDVSRLPVGQIVGDYLEKVDSGLIRYSDATSGVDAGQYHTLTTPRGGEFTVSLSDGSKVYLNSASSLRYPVVFNGNTRTVELMGEAYFEVVNKLQKPFRVIVNGKEAKVLGTAFNIQAYAKDHAVATLVQGKLAVGNGHSSELLKPNDEAILHGNSIKVSHDVNVASAIAWKNGIIDPTGKRLGILLDEIARWYDVQVNNKAGINQISYQGTIDKRESFAEVLGGLNAAGSFENIQFKLEGRTLVVENK